MKKQSGMSVFLLVFFCFVHYSTSAKYSENHIRESYRLGKALYPIYPRKGNTCELSTPTDKNIKDMIWRLANDYYFRSKTEEDYRKYIERYAKEFNEVYMSSKSREQFMIDKLFSFSGCRLYKYDYQLLIEELADSLFESNYFYRDGDVLVSFKDLCLIMRLYICLIDPLDNKTSLDANYFQNLCLFIMPTDKQYYIKTKRHYTADYLYSLALKDPRFSYIKRKPKIFQLASKCFADFLMRNAHQRNYICVFEKFDNTEYDEVRSRMQYESANRSGSWTTRRKLNDDLYKNLDSFLVPERISGKKECPDFGVDEDQPEFILYYNPKRSIIKLYNGYLVITVVVMTFTLLISVFVLVRKYIKSRRNMHLNQESAALLS